ncbi:unnamed protein product [Dimorphilus gyrociliatus]|uniref:RING-type domain-containing protein n=1 Tax=Dimorphilus gyrociliatus TaxID=2664684 RepID=A0A7I8VP75_9ANNE|nr:unnamed protein product [Dimorphilus gyrociliatus]
MAATNSYIIDEENLICAICLDIWLEKDPRILPCQHTFCRECLEKLAIHNTQITCCLCKVKHKIPKGKIVKIKKNSLKSSLQNVSTVEKLCIKHKKEASLYCKTHKIVDLCSKCCEINHFECDINTMKNQEKRLKLMNSYEESEKEMIKNQLKEIDDIEIIWINKIKEQFQLIKKQLDTIGKKKITEFKNVLQNLHCNENLKELIDIFLKGKTNVKLLNEPEVCYKIEQFNRKTLYSFRAEKDSSNSFIDFSQNCKNTDDVQRLMKLLEGNTKIETIDISNNIKVGDNLREICEQLQNSSNSLREIIFEKCNLNEQQCFYIGKMLLKCSRIESIRLGGNSNMGNGLLYICEGVESFVNSLKRINFNYCQFNNHQCYFIKNLLLTCSNLEVIDLGQNRNMGDDGLQEICQSLEKSSNCLKEINFYCCNLNEKQCNSIGKLLMNCSKIELINLAWNFNMENGLNNICNGLSHSVNSLTVLNFALCNLKEKSCSLIENLLKSCCNIEKINLSENKEMGKGLILICQSLEKSANSLKDIDLSLCDLSQDQCISIGCLLKNCRRIETINLEFNENMGFGLLFICFGLQISLNSLKEINFASCNINESLCSILETLFSSCSKIEIINLSNNRNIVNGLYIWEGIRKSFSTLKKMNFDAFHLQLRNLLQNVLNTNGRYLLMNNSNWSSFDEIWNENMTDGIINVCKGLENSSNNLREINISSSNLNRNVCHHIMNMLKKCSRIDTINIGFNENIGKDGLFDICQGLENSVNTLKELVFTCCNLDENKCKIIGNLLIKCYKIQIINLALNRNMETGLLCICDKLQNSANNLKEINVECCNLYDSLAENISYQFTNCTVRI